MTKPISQIPQLRKQGGATQLWVDGKPFLILGGELFNSSSSSLSFMEPLWPKLAASHLNTLLLPIAWDVVEAEEGRFDWAIVDGLIEKAR
ncbi:MAG TPA: beta-galactosidase, partial [Fimbriimonas sp.]